ncbi:hypothetical protein [Natronorubrum sp. FCH18a]|uniref:hypothetical protein n=1 Tax=Natronorubrum sp. FCH18a TaxID=3447018 RepID=UPI003F519B56
MTGLLSKGEREFFNGEKEPDDPDGYRRNARYRARKRIEQIEQDLELLEEAGEDDIVAEFHQQFSRVGQLEREVNRLREQVDESSDSE